MKFSLASVLAFAASTMAITITSPAMNALVPISQSFPVTWTTVNTDPTSVSIVLVNNAISPGVNIPIASNIPTSQGTFTITPSQISAAKAAAGYQVNLVSTTNGGILAQTNQFSLVASGSSSSSASTTSATSTTTKASTTLTSVVPVITTTAAPFPISNGTAPTTARASGSGVTTASASPSAFTGAASSVQISKDLGLVGAALMGLAVIFG